MATEQFAKRTARVSKEFGFPKRTRRCAVRTSQLARGPQTFVRQVQAVHDLVVLVARRERVRTGERVGERALEIDVAPVALVEERVLGWVVEAVLVVRDDLAGRAPRAVDAVGLGVPHLAEKARPAP